MEEVFLNWPSEAMLEPLRPLTPESVESDQSNSFSTNLDQLSQCAKTEKLLDHLDELSMNTKESELFDWFSNEKSINIPSSETMQPLTHEESQESTKSALIYDFLLGSPEYNPVFTFPDYEVQSWAQMELTCPSSATDDLPESLYQTSAIVQTLPESYMDVQDLCTKEEVLTPPYSPTGEIITPPNSSRGKAVELFEETESELGLDKIKFKTRPDVTDSSTMSENSDDVDYVPQNKQRRSTKRKTPTNEKSKSYVRQVWDGRKIRKKAKDERKLRKMEQNKVAASRYRLKKKLELEKCKNEENLLKKQNKQLRNQLDDISREIKCLKSLLSDAYGRKRKKN